MPEHGRRQLHLTAGHGAADGGGTDGLVGPVGARHQREWVHLEVVRGAELAQRADVAATPAAEVEVVAHHDGLGGQAVDEHPLREVERFLLRLLRVEADDHGGVDPGACQEFELLVEVGEQLRRALGSHHRGRMPVERDDHRPGADGSSTTTHFGDDRLVTEVHPVVGADGDDGTFAGERGLAEIGHDSHGPRRYPLAVAAGVPVGCT